MDTNPEGFKPRQCDQESSCYLGFSETGRVGNGATTGTYLTKLVEGGRFASRVVLVTRPPKIKITRSIINNPKVAL
ncbi:hypothetical protein TNCV_635691 [Trichonephila clavipes]|nr:hypothetical protein TNCV_635691 [Trichonephila clavipes]